MNIELFFPTAICSIKNLELAEEMLPIARKYLADKNYLTNQWGYKNTYTSGVGIEQNMLFFNFVDILKTYAEDYMKTLGYKLSKSDFSIYLFASEMKEGDQHNVHTHQNSILSGVFYLQVPTGSADLIFYDPRPFRKFVSYPILQQTEITWDHIVFKPEKGILLMWESWIEHAVPKNNNQDGRITLVFNISKNKG